jgi:hypothetical protein
MPEPAGPKRLSKQELLKYLQYVRGQGRDDLALEAVKELAARGEATSAQLSLLRWNQDRVKLAMGPFVEVAKAVKGNKRTPYTEAGGRKIGKSRDDPDRMWIDTYSGVKLDGLNLTFTCYVQKPGDDPDFVLSEQVTGIEKHYVASELQDALAY